MSIKDLADHMKATGRRGDTELVHMTKGEVAGLQQLAMAAGGNLTINPQTGLPEANFLKQMLPTILGMGAMMIPGMQPIGAAMIGGATGMMTNKDDPLMGAITGGLGGFGGASLGAGMGLGGAGAAGGAATPFAMPPPAGFSPAITSATAPVGAAGATPFMLPTQAGAAGFSPALTTAATPQAMTGMQMLKSGSMAMAPGLMSQRPMEMPDDTGSVPEYDFSYNPTGAITAGSDEVRHFDPRFTRRMAEGGIASLAQGGMKAGGFVVSADAVSMSGEGNTDAGYERIAKAIPGAVPIRGKDGGQADTVATSIEGKQPARIAHGEMYVPPAAVAGLAGKGTPPAKRREAGAKKLYAMMDNVRKQATGSKRQIKPVNMRKALA